MILPGHFATAYMAAHYARVDERLALVAAIAPDVVDKTGRYVLQISPSGRLPAHSLAFALLSIALVWLVFRRRTLVLGWAAGYLTHITADIILDIMHGNGSEYLLWPFVAAVSSRYKTAFASIMAYSPWAFVLEGLVTLAGILLYLRSRRGRPLLPSTLRRHSTGSN
jgi:hypothetical protein